MRTLIGRDAHRGLICQGTVGGSVASRGDTGSLPAFGARPQWFTPPPGRWIHWSQGPEFQLRHVAHHANGGSSPGFSGEGGGGGAPASPLVGAAGPGGRRAGHFLRDLGGGGTKIPVLQI